MATTQTLREQVLRSINIKYDADHPERIAHFRPTAKSVTLLRALLGEEDERAYFVVAPYGSGKSLTSTYALHLIENRKASQAALQTIETRLEKVSPSLADFSSNRRGSDALGLVIVLEGYVESTAIGFQQALLSSLRRNKLLSAAEWVGEQPCEEISHVAPIMAGLRKKLKKQGVDRFVLLWDEFGRHLETLTSKGKTTSFS